MRWALTALGGLLLALSVARADVPADNTWTNAERWAWSQISAGRPADFDVLCHNSSVAPADKSAWDDPCRFVRGVVLEQMLTYAPWRDAMQHQGLWMMGVRVIGDINLATHIFVRPISLTPAESKGIFCSRAHDRQSASVRWVDNHRRYREYRTVERERYLAVRR